MSLEIKSKIAEKRAEAVQRLVSLSSSNLSEYTKQQGIIQGLDLATGIVVALMKEEEGKDE